jgi:uncharacterized membrane protein YdbT with pleckstrin-like domain
VLSVLLVVLLAYFHSNYWLVICVAIAIFVPSVIKHVSHIQTVYTLTNVKLETSEGLFSKSKHNIPLRHIHDISVQETFRERIFGIGDIIVDTAALDTNLVLKNVKDPDKYANLILDQLERWH